MKKGAFIFVVLAVFMLNFASAACALTPTLINQDPYPAVPGDYVRLVFQITGVENPQCNTVTFRLVEQYPFSFDPGVSSDVSIKGGTYTNDYGSHLIIPYKVRLDNDALDGNTTLEFVYTTSNFSAFSISTDFNLVVEDVKSDFEVYVKDYSKSTQTITFEILNIGDVDVEALTIENLNQDNVEIKGANREIVGDLDSNEYTTADFEAIAKEGDINLKIIYTDSVNVRRELNKTISFNPDYFNGLNRDKKSVSWLIYVLILAVAGFIAWRFYRRHKRKKLHQQKSAFKSN